MLGSGIRHGDIFEGPVFDVADVAGDFSCAYEGVTAMHRTLFPIVKTEFAPEVSINAVDICIEIRLHHIVVLPLANIGFF